MTQTIIALLSLSLLCAQAAGAWKFKEVNGLVSMEAEHTTTGAWKIIKGTSGSAFEDPGQGDLTYNISFTSTGKFYVSMLAGTNICGGDKANDCWITLDGQKLYGSDNVTRPDGIRVGNSCCVATSMCWTQLPRGPGSHTPDNIKYNPVYAIVSSPGEKVFKVIHYAIGFRLDKIVLKLNSSQKPTGTGPAETVLSSSTGLSLVPASPERASVVESLGAGSSFLLDGRVLTVPPRTWVHSQFQSERRGQELESRSITLP